MGNFFAGIRHLLAEEADSIDLGPLTQLQGTWVNKPELSTTTSTGWNVIAVPDPTNGFQLEVIPYTETLSFTPVIAAGNRGPVINGQQVEQQITGLMYEQIIHSACPTAFCKERGFAAGTEIHAERGLFLNVGTPNGNFAIARLSTIPHGNALLALGNSSTSSPGQNHDFIPRPSSQPTQLNGTPFTLVGYTDPYDTRQFKEFDQNNPNTFLLATLGNANIKSLTTLSFDTNNPDAGGGILSIPFLTENVNASRMNASFWIEEIEGQGLQLQYSQTVNLVFPSTNTAIPLVWPHVTINTLVKQ